MGNHYVGDCFSHAGNFFNVKNRSSTSQIGYQHRKVLTKIKPSQHCCSRGGTIILVKTQTSFQSTTIEKASRVVSPTVPTVPCNGYNVDEKIELSPERIRKGF